MMRMTGLLWSGKLQSFMAFSATPLKSSRLIGDPVRTALSAGRYFMVSGNCSRPFWHPLWRFYWQVPGDIRLVDDGRYMAVLCGKHDRYGNEATLRKYYIRLEFFHEAYSLTVAL